MFAPFSNNRLRTIACSLRLLLAGALLTSVATFAFAAPIPGLFNTGVDGGGVTTLVGTNDAHYALIAGPITPIPISTVANPGWVPNNPPTSQWIGPPDPPDTPNVDVPNGTYIYELIFDLTGLDETTAQISGDWSSDNSSLVRLNGTPAAGIPHSGGSTAFQSFDTFSFNTGFVSGFNSLTFEVTNDGGPSGLHVDRLTGTADVPEPASAILALLGMTVCGFIPRRKRTVNNVTK